MCMLKEMAVGGLFIITVGAVLFFIIHLFEQQNLYDRCLIQKDDISICERIRP